MTPAPPLVRSNGRELRRRGRLVCCDIREWAGRCLCGPRSAPGPPQPIVLFIVSRENAKKEKTYPSQCISTTADWAASWPIEPPRGIGPGAGWKNLGRLKSNPW